MKFLKLNFFIFALVFFIFSKELLTIDEEFLVSFAVTLAVLILTFVLKDSLDSFAIERTNTLLNYYLNLYDTQLFYRNSFRGIIDICFEMSDFFDIFLNLVINELFFVYHNGLQLQNIYINFLVNEFLVSYFVYSNTVIRKNQLKNYQNEFMSLAKTKCLNSTFPLTTTVNFLTKI